EAERAQLRGDVLRGRRLVGSQLRVEDAADPHQALRQFADALRVHRLCRPARQLVREGWPARFGVAGHGRAQSGGVKRPSCASQPPSTYRMEPVTKLAASETRNTTAPTSSLG